jgi:Domain of unknown function (DUF4383)
MSVLDRAKDVTSLNSLIASVFGGVYIAVGILGAFEKTGGFAATSGGKLIGIFEVNPLHNLAHLLIGGVLLASSLGGESIATATNIAVGGVYLLLGVLGLFILDSSANILALNGADNILHFASALALLGVGLAAPRLARARS